MVLAMSGLLGLCDADRLTAAADATKGICDAHAAIALLLPQ